MKIKTNIGIVCHHCKLLNVPLTSISFDPVKFMILGDMGCGGMLMLYRNEDMDIVAEINHPKRKRKGDRDLADTGRKGHLVDKKYHHFGALRKALK